MKNVNVNSQNIKLVTIFLGLYFLIIPLNTFLIFGFSVVRFFVVIPIFLSLLYFNKSRKKHRNFIMLLLISFILVCFLQIGYSSFSKVVFNNCCTLLMYIIFVFFVTKLDYNDREKNFINTMFYLSSWFCLILTLFFNYYYMDYRLTLKFFSGNCEDPNYYCSYFIPGIVKCIECILNSKTKLSLKNGFYLLSLLLMIYCCFLSGSRAGLLSIIIAFVLCIFYNRDKFSLKKLFTILIRISFFSILLYLCYSYLSEYLNIGIVSRLSLKSLSETNGNGRLDIWLYLLDLYSNFNIPMKLLGSGIGTTYVTIAAAHNFWITLLFENGVYGVFLFILLFYNLFKISLKNDTKYYFYIIVLYLFLSLSLSIIFYKPLWCLIIALLINEDTKKNSFIENKV